MWIFFTESRLPRIEASSALILVDGFQTNTAKQRTVLQIQKLSFVRLVLSTIVFLTTAIYTSGWVLLGAAPLMNCVDSQEFDRMSS